MSLKKENYVQTQGTVADFLLAKNKERKFNSTKDNKIQ